MSQERDCFVYFLIFFFFSFSYRSVSAFAPICNPSICAWGIKALTGQFHVVFVVLNYDDTNYYNVKCKGYLGDDRTQWKAFDATELLRQNGKSAFEDILIDVGTADGFLKNGQLLPQVRVWTLVSTWKT